MKKNYDRGIFIPFLILLVWGFYNVFNTTKLIESSQRYMLNQTLATVIGIIGFIIIMKLSPVLFERLYPLIYAVSVLLLIWVLFAGTGYSEWGAKSWIRFSHFGFQPAEIVKPGFILFFAGFLAKYRKRINEKKIMLTALILMAVPVTLIMLQPDFGTDMVYLFIFAAMLLSAGINKRYIAAAVSLIAAAAPLVWLSLSTYQKKRIFAFLDSSYDIGGSGYQVFISKEAISTSGLFGKGLIRDNSDKFMKVPENHTDFVFSAITESFGILGGLAVIILFVFLIYRISRSGRLNPNKFQSFALYGFSAMIFCHFFENTAMTMGAMPMTGISLPFMSYGGTFQLMNILSIAFCCRFSIGKSAGVRAI